MRHLVSGKVIGSFLVVCALVGTAALTAGASPAASAQRASQSMRGGSVVALRAGHGQQPFRVVPQRDAAQLRAKSATITINYIAPGTQNALGDNCLAWPAGSQAAFNYAASIWESLIDSSVPIEINACWANLGYGVLGHSATDSFHRDFSGAPIASTWYPAALANALHGTDLNNSDSYDDDGDGADADAEMEIAYSGNGISWYFGTDGATPMGQYDFVSVVLHEICHGLGFAGTMSVSGGVGSWGWGSGYPAAYDRFTENGTGDSLVDDFPNNSAALGTQLTGNSLYFDGPNANAANGGSRPKLYAPSTWNPGSSYSHLDEIFNGTANALMTYSLDDGEAVHDPGPVTSGILQDVGWTMGAPASNVSIVKQVVGSDLEPGDSITFTLSVQNSGTLTATTPIVTDTIPVEVLTPTFSSTLAVTPTGVISYVWEVEPLTPGQSGVITVCGWIDSGLESDFSFTNEATISDPDDVTPGNNTSSATVGERYVYLPLVMRSSSGSGGGGVVNGNFEQGTTGWTEYSTHWLHVIVNTLPVSAHSGSWATWLGGAHDETSYIQQQVTVPSSQHYLAYYHWINSEDICGYDLGGVIINGTTVVDVYDLCSDENTGGWVKHVVNLGAYAGQSVSLQIRIETDSSLVSHLLVDDVSFQASAAGVSSSSPAPIGPAFDMQRWDRIALESEETKLADFLFRTGIEKP
jgi:uncharacterized repeat protein (TIGR01451 family)